MTSLERHFDILGLRAVLEICDVWIHTANAHVFAMLVMQLEALDV